MYTVKMVKKLGFELYLVLNGNVLAGSFLSLQYATRKAYMLNNGRK